MERQNRQIYQDEDESDNEVNHGGEGSSEDEGRDYCFGSVPVSKLQSRKVFSEARWVSEMGMAEIVIPKGPIWRTTGVVRCGKVYCSIEEALFLVELGALVLKDDSDAIISTEDVYAKLSEETNGCCWNYFQAYRQLKSLGYIVGRHGIPWTLKSVNGSSKSSDPQCSAKFVSEGWICIGEMLSKLQIEESKPVFDVYLPNSKFRKSCPGEPSFVICFTRGYPPSKETVEVLDRQCGGVPLKFCHVEQGKIHPFARQALVQCEGKMPTSLEFDSQES